VAGISAIAKLLPNCLILSDASNHNSMIKVQSGTNASPVTQTNTVNLTLLCRTIF